MVKTNMSTDGSESEQGSLKATLDKLKIQQRLIDIAARNLEASRVSCRNLSTTGTGISEEAQSTMEENIVLQEVAIYTLGRSRWVGCMSSKERSLLGSWELAGRFIHDPASELDHDRTIGRLEPKQART